MAYIGQAPTNAPLTSSDIQDGVIVAADLADDSVGTDEIVNDAVTADKLANSINTAIAANTAKVSFTPDAAQVFNDTGADVDFRVEASGEAHALFVQGSDGKVGIGTPASTPLGNLHVASGDSSATANANADELVIEGNTVSGLSILSATNSTGNIYFGDSVNNGIGTIIYDHDTNKMSFMTDGSTRINILLDGKVGIGCTPTHPLQVSADRDTDFIVKFINASNSAGGPNILVLEYPNENPDNQTAKFIQGQDSGDEFFIYSDGTYTQASDRRIKENIVDVESMLDKVNSLRVVNYNRKRDSGKGLHVGCIAQEVEDIFPHLVNISPEQEAVEEVRNDEGEIVVEGQRAKEERYMLYKIGLVFPLIKAVQELSAKVTALESA